MNATGGLALAVFIGMLLPLQALINAALGRQTFGPVFAALMSFAVGTVLFLAARNLDLNLPGALPAHALDAAAARALLPAAAATLVKADR